MKIYTLKNEEELFDNIYDLVDYVLREGICPSAEIYCNGENTKEEINNYLYS